MRRLVLLWALLPLAGCFDFAGLLGAYRAPTVAGADLSSAVEPDGGGFSVDAAPSADVLGAMDLAAELPIGAELSVIDALATPDGGAPRDLLAADLATADLPTAPDLADSSSVKKYPLPAGPVDVRVGDVNHDTFLDLVVLLGASKQVLTLLNDGRGAFSFIKSGPSLVLPSTGGLLAGLLDYDGDQRLDLVVTLPTADGLLVASGLGDGTFPATLTIALPGKPIAIVSADFNVDGQPDVAVSYVASVSGVTLLQGGANGLKTPGPVIAAGWSAAPLAAGDLDGDGKTDLIAGNTWFGATSITLLGGLGNGRFKAPANLAGAPINGIAVADLDLDARADLVCGDGPNRGVALLGGRGRLAFDPPVVTLAPGKGQAHLAAADFNLDGNPDVALVERDSSQVTVFDGHGTLTLRRSARVSHPTGAEPVVVRVGDFDGDGRPDLVTADSKGPSITVVLRP